MSRPTIEEELAALGVAELKARFEEHEPTRAEWEALKADRRAGARALVDRIESARRREAEAGRRAASKLKFERALWDDGLERIAGCDEAGVSPLAGPVVAAAVILPKGERVKGVDDSKVLSPETRERLAEEIKRVAVAWAVGMASPQEIDEINPYRGGLLAMRRALEGLNPVPDHVLLDARKVPEFLVPQTPIIKGDALSLTIGAASIIAKTTRDRLMVEMDRKYPGYGFAEHKGYPVKAHVEALRRLGVCEIHRRSYAPVREVLEGGPRQRSLFE